MRHSTCQQVHRRTPRATLVEAVTLLAALGLAACGEPSRVAAPTGQSAGVIHTKYLCTATLSAAGIEGAPSVTCSTPGSGRSVTARSGHVGPQDLVLQNQGINVLITLSNFAYSSTTNIFSLNGTIKNLPDAAHRVHR